MFDKILIANRGEIACRIIRTARRMGIKTVAVHSEADTGALHVEMADEAVAIGPSPSAQSYLVIDRILDACRRTGAQAVHPGYGFLSEKEGFARALQSAGIAFIGPGPDAIAAMGDKIESKKLAQAAGVSTVPGHLGDVTSDEAAIEIARAIGYPVMLKASAGGGGKGMRIARTDQEVRDGLRSARNEARSSFGDERVFIEKYVVEPRHIEIQVLADGHGTCLYLGERECSLQRRHQKVIEEAPSPFLDEATRRAMGEQAVSLAKAVGYSSAGTVEFIVDADRNFYFLEMNTRLQVEHPVTEYVTGLDLVEWMIRIASGERLPFGQEDIRLAGWAIEARIYAEDPGRNFLPSIGRLTRFRPPAATSDIRVDTGVVEGGEISMFYDPMIAKLIAAGPDRPTALARLVEALDAFEVRGVEHNVPFLAALLTHPDVQAGRMSTNLIGTAFPDGFKPHLPQGPALARLAAVAAHVHLRREEQARTISGQLPGHGHHLGTDWVVRSKGGDIALTVRTHDERRMSIAIDGATLDVRSDWRPGQSLWRGSVDGHAIAVQVDPTGIAYRLIHAGAVVSAEVLTPRAARFAALMPVKAAADLSRFLLSPMPGLLVSLAVKVGDAVKAGQELAVVEAMKMENVLRAESDGTVAKLHAAAGDSLAVDQPIIEFG